jgi:hypothetical protein
MNPLFWWALFSEENDMSNFDIEGIIKQATKLYTDGRLVISQRNVLMRTFNVTDITFPISLFPDRFYKTCYQVNTLEEYEDIKECLKQIEKMADDLEDGITFRSLTKIPAYAQLFQLSREWIHGVREFMAKTHLDLQDQIVDLSVKVANERIIVKFFNALEEINVFLNVKFHNPIWRGLEEVLPLENNQLKPLYAIDELKAGITKIIGMTQEFGDLVADEDSSHLVAAQDEMNRASDLLHKLGFYL